MSIKSVLLSTFSHLYPRAGLDDDELLLSLKQPAGGGEPAAEPDPAEPDGAAAAEALEVMHDSYDLEIQHIESRLQSQLTHAQKLTDHLKAEAKRAEQIDESTLNAHKLEHGAVYKNLGLPVDGSNLRVDPSLVKNTGLLHAHELLLEVVATRAEAMCEPEDLVSATAVTRPLARPARATAVTRALARPARPRAHARNPLCTPLPRGLAPSTLAQDLAAREASTRPDPHYVEPTANQIIRLETSKVKRANLVSSGVRGVRELRQTKELAGLTDGASLLHGDAAAEEDAKARLIAAERERRRLARKPGSDGVNLEQQQLETDVLTRMQAKLNFLRNPRHQRVQLFTAAQAPLQPPASPYVGMSFHVRPQVAHFGDYVIGGCYEIALELHNVDHLSRRLRVLPPSTPYFSISQVQYPGDDGFVAPGLHARVLVRFAPDSLGDYDDFLLVQTETDSFGVPLKAARRPPSLSLREVIDVGFCFLGASSLVAAPGRNEGGDGKFAVVSRADWDRGEGIAERVATELECAQNEFVLWPRLLDVPADGAYDLNIRYTPTSIGEHAAELLLVCDNCHVRPVTLVGTSCAVDVRLEELDGRAPPDESSQTAMWFGETPTGGSHLKVIRYSNRTPLPISYRWDLHAEPRERLPLTLLSTEQAVVRSSADYGAPMAHGDGAHGMPFSIEPAAGELPAGAVAEFTVTFAPSAPALHGAYAHFAVTGVPDEALPGKGASHADAEVGLQLGGRGTLLPLELWPVALSVPAPVLVEREAAFEIRVHNPNATDRRVSWRVERADDEEGAEGDGATVQVLPAELTIGAGERVSVSVVALGRCSARVVRHIIATPDRGAPTVVPLRIDFVGPLMQIRQPVVDFGLVAVGDTATVDLAFDNPTDAPTRWGLAPVAGGSHEGGCGEFAFSTASDEIAPRGSASVRVSYTGTCAHELDAALAVAVTRGSESCVRVRGQVVAHAVALDEPVVDLLTTYVRVPAYATITLRNKTLLPTEWHFDDAAPMLRRPASLTFDPPRGWLEPSGTQQVHLTLTSELPGELDEIVRCTVPRMRTPLGLRLRSTVAGLVVSYSVEPATGEGTPLGRELDDAVGAVHSPPAFAYEPPAPLHFGRSVPCFEERHLLLVVRNHSSVPTRFAMRARDHPARVDAAPPPAPPTEGMTTATVAAVLARGGALRAGHSGAGSTRPSLGAGHEPLRRFQSHAGARHVQDALHLERKRALFGAGDEVVFEVTPSEGVLPPWGRVAILVSAHSQMWGRHVDALVCEVEGLETLQLPLDIGVLGSPLALVSNAAGFSMRTVPPELAFPPKPTGHAQLQRRVRVRNDSGFGATVSWAAFKPPLAGGKLVSAALAVGEAGGRVTLRIGPPVLEPLDADGEPPFAIEPAHAVVKPHATVDFTVTFDPRALGDVGARLVATCARDDGERAAHPPIALDVRGCTRMPRLEVSERRKLKVQVTPLDPPSHDSYRRELVLANREDTPLDFALASEPPFAIVQLSLSAGATTSTALSAQTGESPSAPARCVLPPGETVRVQLQFRPTAATASSFAHADGDEPDSPRSAGSDGEAARQGAADEDDDGAFPSALPDFQTLHKCDRSCAARSAPARPRRTPPDERHANARARACAPPAARSSLGATCASCSGMARRSASRSAASCTRPLSQSAPSGSCARNATPGGVAARRVRARERESRGLTRVRCPGPAPSREQVRAQACRRVAGAARRGLEPVAGARALADRAHPADAHGRGRAARPHHRARDGQAAEVSHRASWIARAEGARAPKRHTDLPPLTKPGTLPRALAPQGATRRAGHLRVCHRLGQDRSAARSHAAPASDHGDVQSDRARPLPFALPLQRREGEVGRARRRGRGHAQRARGLRPHDRTRAGRLGLQDGLAAVSVGAELKDVCNT